MSSELSIDTAAPKRASLAGLISWPALAAVVIWSGTAPIAKYALAEFPVLAYTVARPVIASALLFLVLALRHEPILLPRADLRRMAIVGVCGLGVSQLTYLNGLSRTSVAHTVILASISPLLVAVYRVAVKRARLPPVSLLGILGGFAGVVILVIGAGSGSDTSLLGDAFALASAIAWMGVTIWPAKTFLRYGTMRPMAWMFLSSLMLTVPISLGALHRTLEHPPSPLAWASLGYSAVFGALIGNSLWQRSVQSLGPARTLIYLYIQPVGALLLAAIILGERMNLTQAAGGVLALVGVGLVRRE
jgi:drug/metabolite transporter (DMT)-like permease